MFDKVIFQFKEFLTYENMNLMTFIQIPNIQVSNNLRHV